MAYLDEQALLRSVNRQRMLAGQDPVTSLVELAGGRVKPVRQTEVDPLRVQMPQGGGPQVAQLTAPQDNSLAQAISGIGSGGGIQQMLANMRAARAAPTPGVVRGADLPTPTPRHGAQLPQMASRGQYRTEAPPAQPIAPERPVPQRQAPQRPQASPQGQPSQAGQSGILARQRAPYASQMESNPAVKEKMMALMVAEEGGDRDARTALAESAYNRGSSRNINNIDQVLDPRYYQPMHDGSGSYERALARVRSDPKLRAELEQDLGRANGGSNVSNLATDNASAGVAANSKTNQTHTHTTANGESWFRKDVRPDVHGALAVKQTKDWHDNTTAAMVDEKPEPAGAEVAAKPPAAEVAAAPQAPAAAEAPVAPPQAEASGAAPQWLRDTVSNYATEKGLPPGNVGSFDQPLSKEALLTHGLNRAEEMKAAEAPPPQQASAQPLSMTPEIGKAAISATQPNAPKGSDTLRSALWAGTRGDQGPPIVEPPKPDLQQAPPPPGPIVAQDKPEIAAATLPQGNAPQQFIDAATTGQVSPSLSPIPQVQTNWEPPPQMAQTQLGLNSQPFGMGSLSPIPWDWMGGWGWGAPGGGIDMAGGFGNDFGSGASGFDFFGGGNMGGW